MGLFEQLYAITRNTFFESIRQPIMLVILIAATLAIVLSNPLSAYTMAEDQHMMIGLGLSTVFLCGGLIAAFVATSVLTREIDNKTALTVISKPVGRPLFIIGKFLGVCGAIALATLYMALVFLVVEQQDVFETVRVPVNVPVIVFGVGALVLGVLASTWCNYFYNMVFASTMLCITTPLLAVAYVLTLMFGPDFTTQSITSGFRGDLWQAVIAMTMAVFVLVSVAIAASTRLGQVMTLVVTMGAFVVGLLSNWIFGARAREIEAVWLDRARAAGQTITEERIRTIEYMMNEKGIEEVVERPESVEIATVPLTNFAEGGESLTHTIMKFGTSITPNFDAMLLTDAVTQEHQIPGSYVIKCVVYGLCFIIAFLSLATILFQRREVG